MLFHSEKPESKRRYLFGPVLSRRLGRSLGVDLVPYKVCTYDCIYCQLGHTTKKTVQRKEYVPLNEVLQELHETIEKGIAFDYITLAGSGEPTLHAGIGKFIAAAKITTCAPIAVITNGALLWDPNVRHDLLDADVVIPSLDAASPETFLAVNQPHTSLSFEKVVEGLVTFRQEYTNKLWLEVLLVKDLTDNDQEILALTNIIAKIRPDRVQLTTVTRPPVAGNAKAVSRDVLDRYKEILGNNVEVLSPPPKEKIARFGTASEQEVLDIVMRHPCSLDDIAEGLNIDPENAERLVQKLLEEKRLETCVMNGVVMFVPNRTP